MGLGNGRTSLVILWDIVLCQYLGYHESRLGAGSIPDGVVSGSISTGTIATRQTRVGERNGCYQGSIP